MKPTIVIFVANGSEETETIGTADVLRRGDCEVTLVSITEERTLTGAHNIVLTTDKVLKDVQDKLYDAVVLPGGLPGANHLDESKDLDKILQKHLEAGKLMCAICAAPMVYGKRGMLQGKKASAYPGFEKYLEGAEYSDNGVTRDGNLITGRGPAYVFDFGIAILEALTDSETAAKTADGLLMNGK